MRLNEVTLLNAIPQVFGDPAAKVKIAFNFWVLVNVGFLFNIYVPKRHYQPNNLLEFKAFLV